MHKVVISHPLYKTGMEYLKDKVEITVTNNGEASQILDDLRDADGFILRIGKIGRDTISQCKKLKVITRPGVGFDNVDVEAATEYGIPVVLCPSANWRAVAEHTISLLLAVAKDLVHAVSQTKTGNFNVRNEYNAVDLYKKTIAILGFGNIGKEVARVCHALNMRTVVYDPFISPDVRQQFQYTFVDDLRSALRVADFVTIHMPSTPTTRGLIGKEQIADMKESAFIINTSRGDIIDEKALVHALETSSIAGAGLDVLEDEPMKASNPLMKFSNVVITPHMAAQTQETVDTLVTMAVEGTLAVLAGEKWEHVANPEVYNHSRWK